MLKQKCSDYEAKQSEHEATSKELQAFANAITSVVAVENKLGHIVAA